MSIILLFLMLYFIAYIIGTVQTPILHASLPRALLRRLARQMPASAFPPETEAGQGFDFSLRVSDSRFFSRVLSFKILPGCFRLALTMTFQGLGECGGCFWLREFGAAGHLRVQAYGEAMKTKTCEVNVRAMFLPNSQPCMKS